ncbi:hypothetical protein FWF93_01930 [Candidatus Saccharibacteria bacterium]|nr:hypothetical protein [Candidatus Saccharibacteria bacterium]
MMYSWSWGAFAIGFVLLILSVIFMRYATKVADMFGGAYSKYQLYSYIAAGASLFIMFNLHSFIISFLANNIFGGVK